MSDKPGNTWEPFAEPADSTAATTVPVEGYPGIESAPPPAPQFAAPVPTRRGLGAGGIVAIVIAGVLVAGAVLTGAALLASSHDEPIAQALPPASSEAGSPSPSASPTAAPGQLAVADGRYVITIDPTWQNLEVPGFRELYESLGEFGGAWQTADGVVVMVAVIDGPVSDELMQQTVLGSMRGGASNVGADASGIEVSTDFGTSAAGLRMLRDSGSFPTDEEDIASAAICVVDAGDAMVMFIVAGAAVESAVSGMNFALVDSMTAS